MVQFIFFKVSARVSCRGAMHSAEANSVIVADPDAVIIGCKGAEYTTYNFRVGDFQMLYRELSGQVGEGVSVPFWRKPVMTLPVPQDLFDVASRLGFIDQSLMLRFIYIYCLGIDRAYYSQLLHHFVDSSREFFDFIERNSLNPWPVEMYARELGISMRNLNQLFQDKYGVSTKHWLLERRLVKARELLLMTSKKVTEIAHECGFNSHAHFSDTFRKRYNDCPRRIRQAHVGL
jgi:AraC-like DNA-binding protein